MELNGLIPTRFMLLLGHLVLTIVLFWSVEQNIISCLPETYTAESYEQKRTAMIAGLAMAIALIVIELFGFLSGITMFMATQDVLSIFAHGSAAISLAFFIFESWPCSWYWYIFGFCSVFPGVTEIISLIGFSLNWNL